MTQKQLSDLGFYVSNHKRVYHAPTESEFSVPDLKKMKAPDFITLFHNRAFEDGVKYGKILKTEEIKKALSL